MLVLCINRISQEKRTGCYVCEVVSRVLDNLATPRNENFIKVVAYEKAE